MVVKGMVIPGMLLRALDEVHIRREIDVLVSHSASLLLGALGTGAAVLYSSTLPLAPEHAQTLVVPASLATVLTGFLMLTTRNKTITQVVGYLTLENGIFIFGLMLIDAMPLLVEVGALLDLVVGIFVMGLVISRIHREFSSIDTTNLKSLRD
jgi:hydrogenase-4 component E